MTEHQFLHLNWIWHSKMSDGESAPLISTNSPETLAVPKGSTTASQPPSYASTDQHSALPESDAAQSVGTEQSVPAEGHTSQTSCCRCLTRLMEVFLISGTCLLMIGLCLGLPISMVSIGSLFLKECPASEILPYLMIAGGTTIMLTLFGNIMGRRLEQLTVIKCRKCFLWVMALIAIFWVIGGDYVVLDIFTPEYEDKTSSKYCNRILYLFSFAIIAIINLGALIIVFTWCTYNKFKDLFCTASESN